MQSPQSATTPWRLTLDSKLVLYIFQVNPGISAGSLQIANLKLGIIAMPSQKWAFSTEREKNCHSLTPFPPFVITYLIHRWMLEWPSMAKKFNSLLTDDKY